MAEVQAPTSHYRQGSIASLRPGQTFGFAGNLAFLLFMAGVGVGVLWLARNLWLAVKRTRNGISAVSTIEELQRSGNYLTGQFDARITFKAGNTLVATELGLTSSQWNRLRAGQTIRISYSPTDPRIVSLGGSGVRRFYQVAACLLAATGVFIIATVAWMLAAGLAGWGNIDLTR